VNRPLQSVEVRDESANPTDSFGVPGFVTGSAVAQIAKDNSSDGSSGILPTDGFTLTLEAAIGPEHFVITDVGQPYAQLDYFKQTISFKKAVRTGFRPVTMTLEIDEVPGLKLALEREAFLRDAAFLPVNESIAGFEAVPMTLREYGLLRLMKSPLLAFTLPTPVQLTQFPLVSQPAVHTRKWQKPSSDSCADAAATFIHQPRRGPESNFLRRRWERKTLKQLKAFSDVVACARHLRG